MCYTMRTSRRSIQAFRIIRTSAIWWTSGRVSSSRSPWWASRSPPSPASSTGSSKVRTKCSLKTRRKHGSCSKPRRNRDDSPAWDADPQYHGRAYQSLDHRGLFRAAALVRPVDVPSDAVFPGGLVRRRTMDPGRSPVDRHGAAGELSWVDRAVLARQFLEPRRYRLDESDRPCAREPGGRRARGGAIQRRPEVRFLVHGAPGAGAVSDRAHHLGGVLRVRHLH